MQNKKTFAVTLAVLLCCSLCALAQRSDDASFTAPSVCCPGTPGTIAMYKTSSTLSSSNIFQNASGEVGIGTNSPYARLDVRLSGSTLPNIQDENMVAVFDGGGNATNVYTNVLPSGGGGTDTNYYLAMNGIAQGGLRYNVTGNYVALFNSTDFSLNTEPFVLQGRNVGIGTLSPANNLEIGAGGTTLADAWTTRSSRQFKTNIQPLEGALTKIEQLQGVTYDRRSDGKHEIGVVAEDVDQIVPEIVSRDPKTKEIQGVDYSRLSALLIEAVKEQQVEIERLKAQILQLSRHD